MRVSGSGRKPVINTQNRKVSSSSLEEKILQGKSNINRSVSSNTKEDIQKENSTPLETEKVEIEMEHNKIEKEKINTDTEKKKVDKEKTKVRKKKEKNSNRKDKSSKFKPPTDIGRLGKKRIACMVLTGMASSLFLGGVVYGTYYNLIRYPSQMKENVAESGLGGIERWLDALSIFTNESISTETGVDSYLAKELEYANGDEDKIDFFKKMISTVEYSPKKVKAKNIYGNDMISRVDDSIVYTDSLVNGESEEVKLKYIDYTKVPLDEEKIKSLVVENKLTLGLGDYSNGLVSIFCKYMNSLDEKDIPLTSINHIPNMIKVGSVYKVTTDEDILLDKILFSSEEFYDLLIRFSEVAATGVSNPEWDSWNKLSEEDKKNNQEPSKVLEALQPTSAWQDWNAKSDDEKKTLTEPVKYDSSKVMSTSWCGSYYLLNEHQSVDSSGNVVNKPIEADVGNGTIENPASVNTGVVTSMFVSDMEGNRVAKPIKVKLIDYKISQDALNYFETKDTRNRGYDIKSEVQYISYTFEVTNLSNEELVIYDNSSLSDGLANLAPRTGTVYGLKNSVKLKPYETGIIESWGCSTELNKKYVIWGGDFNRELPVVWFRVLAGDIDDPSEEKGVTINNKEEAEEETGDSTLDGVSEESTNVE